MAALSYQSKINHFMQTLFYTSFPRRNYTIRPWSFNLKSDFSPWSYVHTDLSFRALRVPLFTSGQDKLSSHQLEGEIYCAIICMIYPVWIIQIFTREYVAQCLNSFQLYLSIIRITRCLDPWKKRGPLLCYPSPPQWITTLKDHGI